MSHTASLRERDGVEKPQLLSTRDFAVEYGVPETTQAVWRCTNRYGFRDLVIKLGTGIRYRRSDVEAWLESRRATTLAAQ